MRTPNHSIYIHSAQNLMPVGAETVKQSGRTELDKHGDDGEQLNIRKDISRGRSHIYDIETISTSSYISAVSSNRTKSQLVTHFLISGTLKKSVIPDPWNVPGLSRIHKWSASTQASSILKPNL